MAPSTIAAGPRTRGQQASGPGLNGLRIQFSRAQANATIAGRAADDGLMVDAPDFGETVRVEPGYWGAFVGAVRIG